MNIWTRRGFIAAGAAAGAGAAGWAANRAGLIPPDHDGLYGIGETLTYASHRLLLSGHSTAREFRRDQISKDPHVNGAPPRTSAFVELMAANFAPWKLEIDGLVERPGSFSLGDLKDLPARSQITHLACEEGWSFIAEWTGVALAEVLMRVGVRPEAKYVVYFSFDPAWWDSLDMAEAMHPQTLLAYAMNGEDLPINHGAPLRMRVPRQLGYKSVKHLGAITVTDSLKEYGKGSSAPEAGYAWYAGI